MMVAAFGRRFLKGLLNIIAIFLFIISIGGCYFIDQQIKKIMDPFSFATSDDWTLCIVGTVTVICFLVCATSYMLVAREVRPEGEEGHEEKEDGVIIQFLQKVCGVMLVFMLPFAVMGYCLPFFLLDSIAGIVVGVIGEGAGLALAVAIVRSVRKSKKKEKVELETQEEK